MTTPFWCLLVIAFLPLTLAPIAAFFKTKQLGSVDNKEPRVQSAQLTGAGGRAVAAQENAWEALAIFSVAVIVNHLAGAAPGASANAATLFVAARILHAIFYVAGQDKLRSGVFLVAVGSVIWLWILSAQA